MFDFLQKGDKVSLISAASFADEKAVKILSELLLQSELIPIFHKDMNNLESSPYANQYALMPYASSDNKRLKGFQEALNSDSKVLWILHGGQGCEKIIAAIERGDVTLSQHKKMIIGFSGVTNLHLYFLNKGWPCLHGPVGTISKETFDITNMPINAEASLKKVIQLVTGKIKTLNYAIYPINDQAKQNTTIINNTSIVGGCLNILVTHLGTPTQLRGNNKIVFIEDEPQRPERIETMFMGLIRSGTFTEAKAVLLGNFSDPNFDTERFKTIQPKLLERIAALLSENGIKLPVFHSDNFGHGDLNDPLPLGTLASIQAGNPATLTISISDELI